MANSRNKQKLIIMLRAEFQHCGYQTNNNVEGDANLLICNTIVDSTSRRTTILHVSIGNNTDLLVILCFHANPNSINLYLRSRQSTPLTGSLEYGTLWLQEA